MRQKQTEINQKDAQVFELQAEIAKVKRESELRALEIKSYQEQLAALKDTNIKSIQQHSSSEQVANQLQSQIANLKIQLNTHNSASLMAEQNLQNIQQSYKKDLALYKEQLDEANSTVQRFRLVQ